MVFPVADERVPHGGKLRPDLVLQPCHQLNPDERGIRKNAFYGISKFGAGRLRVSGRPQLLKHSLAPKIMDQRARSCAETAAHYREILPYRSVGEKLLNERITVAIGLGKQQDPGGKTVNAMNDQRSLSFRLEFSDQQRQSG